MNYNKHSPDRNGYERRGARNKRIMATKNQRPASTSSDLYVLNDGGIKRNFKRIALEAETFQLVKDERFAEALEVMKELHTLQPTGWNRVYTLLLKIECETLCGETAVETDIESVTQLLLMTRPTNMDLMDVALEFSKTGKYIRTIVLFLAGIELYKQTLYGDAIVRGVKSCVKHVTSSISALVKQESKMRNWVKDSIIPRVRKATEEIDQVDGSTKDIAKEQKARCLYDNALCWRLVGENEASIEIFEEALQLMQDEFRSKAVKFQVYSRCISGLGQAYKSLGQTIKATAKFETALSVIEKATDWTTKEQKLREIAYVKQLMKSG